MANAIDHYLSHVESRDVRDGDDAYYNGVALEHVGPYPNEFLMSWQRFEERLKHDARFFDDECRKLLDELFADLPSLADGKAIIALEPGGEFSALYRARIVNDNSQMGAFIRDPALHIGPPPPHLARAGRMNPIGIPVSYGAFSEEVAVAEVRPPVGAVVAIGKFVLLRAVRLLDVTFLPFLYHKESIFSRDYDNLRNKIGFLDRFNAVLSRPVLPSDEPLDYLPTQAFAAYVSSVLGLNGVIYESTQIGTRCEQVKQANWTECSIVLFGEAALVEGSVIEEPEQLRDYGPPTPCQDEYLPPRATPALRVQPQPTLVKIRSVAIATSRIVAQVHEDGSLFIDYGED